MIDFFSSKDSGKVQFSQDILKMYSIFCSLHPKNSFSKDDGVIRKCFVALKNEFPNYHDEILKHTSEVFTFRRLRFMNDQAIKPSKDTDSKHAMTPRGATVNARNSML